jgi:hypothetical protein
MRWEGHVALMEERRRVYWVLVGKSKEKIQFGRTRLRWEDNIKMYLQEVGCGVYTGASWLRIGKVSGTLNAVINFLFPQNAGNFLTN